MTKESWEIKYIYTDKNGKVWDYVGMGGCGNPLDRDRAEMESFMYQHLQMAMNDYTSPLSEEEKAARYAKLETCDNPQPNAKGTPVAITDVLA